MLWLPAPDRATASPIAVSDASAARLECALLDTDAAAAAVHLRTALLVDPWFCHWMAAWPETNATTIDELAHGFADNLVPRLSILDNTASAWTRPSQAEQASFSNQAAAILARAMQHTDVGADLAGSTTFLAAVLEPDNLPNEATVANEYLATHAGVEWRLPRLISRLTASGPITNDFVVRLQQAKLEAMKELAYGASHEVNNPLANISGRAQAMLREETEPRKRRLLAAIDAQAIRAHEMISDLMLFARPPALEMQSTDLGSLIAVVLDELRAVATDRQVAIEVLPPEIEVVASVDPAQIGVAFKALVQNGIDAVGNDGRVTVDMRSSQSSIEIRVIDNGPGITDDVREHMFDPFYSGREAGRGLGFGLSKCWRIAKEHGGNVEVEKTSVAGTTFLLTLPINHQE